MEPVDGQGIAYFQMVGWKPGPMDSDKFQAYVSAVVRGDVALESASGRAIRRRNIGWGWSRRSDPGGELPDRETVRVRPRRLGVGSGFNEAASIRRSV